MSRCTEKFLGGPLLRVQKTKSLSVPFLKAPFKKPAATLRCDISHEMDGGKLVATYVVVITTAQFHSTKHEVRFCAG